MEEVTHCRFCVHHLLREEDTKTVRWFLYVFNSCTEQCTRHLFSAQDASLLNHRTLHRRYVRLFLICFRAPNTLHRTIRCIGRVILLSSHQVKSSHQFYTQCWGTWWIKKSEDVYVLECCWKFKLPPGQGK